MNETDYWARFMATGKIDDFLAYRNAEDVRERDCTSKETAGEHSHAGVYTGYGHDIKG